jgi:hypothetical protein
VGGLVFAGAALADDPGYVDEYYEPLPTGGGNEHTGGSGGSGGSGGGGGSGSYELPSATQENLSSSVSAPVAEALESVATSPELGAPQGTIRKREKARQGDAGSGSGSDSSDPVVVRVEPLEGSPLTDAVAAATDGGNSHLLGVLAALAGITAGAAGLALARRRRSG